MARLKTYTEFVNEGIMDVIKNPIKYTKIKNNAKKYQKAKVASALNDVDYAKRLNKSKGELTSKQKEVLKQANKAKNTALADTSTAISQRMDDLATTPGLQQIVKLAKTTSKIAANKIVLKSATGEEAKQLKIKEKSLEKKAADAKTALKDYESTEGEEETTTPTNNDDAPKDNEKEETDKAEEQDKADLEKAEGDVDTAKSDLDMVKRDSSDDPKAILDSEIKHLQAKQKLAKLKADDDGVKDIGLEIEGKMKEIQKITDAKTKVGGEDDPDDGEAKATADANAEDKADADKIAKDKAADDELEKEKEKKDESSKYLNESVSAKFARLRPNK